MKQALVRSGNVVAVDFAKGVLPIECDTAFYNQLLEALTDTLTRLFDQVPEGRELCDIATIICEDNKSLATHGYFDGSDRFADAFAGIRGIEYDRGNPLTHPAVIDNALRFLATNRKALN